MNSIIQKALQTPKQTPNPKKTGKGILSATKSSSGKSNTKDIASGTIFYSISIYCSRCKCHDFIHFLSIEHIFRQLVELPKCPFDVPFLLSLSFFRSELDGIVQLKKIDIIILIALSLSKVPKSSSSFRSLFLSNFILRIFSSLLFSLS